MNKNYFFLCTLSFFLTGNAFTQVKWSTDSLPADRVAWDNYSISYNGEIDDTAPFVETAVPYNGMYSNFDDISTLPDMSFAGSLYRSNTTLRYHSRKLYTYDSSQVYFWVDGIPKHNASAYEYRVTLNANTVITPWKTIDKLSDSDIKATGKETGYLGGYKTSWGNYIIVELRKKGTDTTLSSAIVYWKETKPAVSAIYTSKNLNEFLISLKRPWDNAHKPTYGLTDLSFPSSENSIIFCLDADVYKKEAIEYQLTKDGEVYSSWKSNEFDNNFIWLKELTPGKYKLEIRYRRQRQSISACDFNIRPAWYQTAAFKIITGGLIAAFFGFIILLLRLRKDKVKTRREQALKERLHLELKSVYSQLNPHFIFNALGSIQGLINKNEPGAANQYLSEFGSLLRDSLANANKDFNTLDSELLILEKYLKLEQLRFRFSWQIQVDGNINPVETNIPSLLLQPLLENAVKHGVAGLQEKGNIQLNFIRENNDMRIVILDNGKGFTPGVPTTGYGLRLTTERINLLNKMGKYTPITLDIPYNPSPGTVIHLLFKNWLS